MAKPTYYPDWATETVTLPGTGNTNKIRPKETIRTVGMDFGQIMTAEELNWILNNFGLWIHYLVDEFNPTLPNTYLPLVGTKITMAGDATGNVTWNGNKAVTLSIQVVDNSHNHLSANITDATSNTVTPNVLVKRDANGSIYAGDTYVCGTTSTDASTIFFRNFSSRNVGNISSTPAAGGNLSISRINPTSGSTTAAVSLYDAGYVNITSPRSTTAQDTANGAALVRLDYLNSRVTTLQNNINNVNTTLQNNINNVNTNLQNQINNLKTTASKARNGWWKDPTTGLIYQWMTVPHMGEGTYVASLPIQFPSAVLFVIGAVSIAIDWGNDGNSCSAGMRDRSTVNVTTDVYGTSVWAVGY